MSWKKENEAYFGDTFNRDSTTWSYAVASDNDLTSLSDYVDTITTCANGIAYGKADKATSGVIKASDFVIESATDSLSTALKQMQAQIDELKLNMVPKTGAHKLRSALATLKYEREIK